MRHVVLLSLLALLLVPILRVAAQPEVAPANGRPPQKLVAGIPAELNLTDEQKTKINDLTVAMRTALEAWSKGHKEQLEKLNTDLNTAQKANNKDDIQRLQGEIKVLQDERNAIEVKYRQDVMNILTPDQQAMWAGLRVYQQGEYAQITKMLQLTPEQQNKLMEQAKVYAAAQAKWEQENGEKSRQLVKQMQEAQAALSAIRASGEKLNADNHAAIQALLTPEQQTALTAAMIQQSVLGRFGKLKLTDEQLDKVKQLCLAAVTEFNQASATEGKTRYQVIEKLAQTINDQVLTDVQRADLKPKK